MRHPSTTDTIGQWLDGSGHRIRRIVYNHRLLHSAVAPFYHVLTRTRNFNSGAYWERRYQLGGNSGPGSYGQLAEYKARFLNDFVRTHDVSSVIEFGSGDGAQLGLFDFKSYIGLDVSKASLRLCIDRYAHDQSKSFYLYDAGCVQDNHGLFAAELSLSLDVIYHLVEDEIYEKYLHSLFAAARRYVIIYASNKDENTRTQAQHVRHRKFTDWVEEHEPEWMLVERVANEHSLEKNNELDGSFADFYIYSPRASGGSTDGLGVRSSVPETPGALDRSS